MPCTVALAQLDHNAHPPTLASKQLLGHAVKRLLGGWLIAITLAGCATFGQLEAGLSSLVGRPQAEAVNALGYPDGRQEFGADTIYIWGRSQNTTMFLPQTQTTTGTVGMTPIYATSTSMQAIPLNYNCTIKIIVADGIIKSWDYAGNLGGCSPYIRRINEYMKR